MKRTLLVLLLPLLLAGCAQVFNGNLFQAVDAPPGLDSSALSKASLSDIKKLMADESFAQRLKNDPNALAAVQEALNNTVNSTSATDADRLDAGTTLVELTASASGVADMKTDAINHISTISDAVSAGKYALALKIFMGNQTEAEIRDTLKNLRAMAGSLATMQTLATKADDTLDKTKFFAATKDKGAFSQSALMAAIASALINDSAGADTTAQIATLAADLSLTDPTTGNGGTDMVEFIAAKGGDATYTVTAGTSSASNYCYTYVAIIIPELPFGL